MRQYTKDDIVKFFNQYRAHLQFAVVAHTNFRSSKNFDYSMSDQKFQKRCCAVIEKTSRITRHVMNCFSSSLYPGHSNFHRRKPNLYRPLSFVTLENCRRTTDPHQTVHVNIALGNIPDEFDEVQIQERFREFWVERFQQRDDVWAKKIDPRDWNAYILKEAEWDPRKAFSESSTWDVQNTWIPDKAISRSLACSRKQG